MTYRVKPVEGCGCGRHGVASWLGEKVSGCGLVTGSPIWNFRWNVGIFIKRGLINLLSAASVTPTVYIYIYVYVQYKNNPLSPMTFVQRCSSLIISQHLDAFWSSQREMWFWSSLMAVGCGNRGFCRATAWRMDGCYSLMKQPTGSPWVQGRC